MKRDFLKNLGIEDKDIIDKIMDENSADIGRAKGELQTYKDKVTDLEGQIANKDNEIATLTAKVGDTDALNAKITTLENEKATLTNDLNTKVTAIQKSHAIESGVRDAKAKNVKAVMALLDMDKITYENGALTGLTEQLDTLTKGEDTSFLFGGQSPAGTNPSNPPANGGAAPTSKTLSESIAKALNTT